MAKKKGGSRAENSRAVRRVLAKHYVDLNSLSFSAGLTYINLTGLLVKTDGSEFTLSSVKIMMEDLQHLGNVQSDLANWELNGGMIKKNTNYFKKHEKKSLKTG
ncbi:hypothetical protein N9N67_01090 [Bacteriovoracaceae bacterium]|nr:hypothetical protein [Bacteriovoracaceae bacterium]